jgi:type 1 glutamine amidotransferase
MKKNIPATGFRTILKFILPVFLLLCASAPAPSFHVLVILSRAKDHLRMMTAAKPWLQQMAEKNNFTIDISDDTSLVNPENLSRYQVFVQLQQAPFDYSQSQQAALQHFIEKGNGWVGIHAAGLTGRQFIGAGAPYWEWFEHVMGNIIYSPHPAYQKGTVIVEDHKHPVMRNLPDRFEVSDEWYEFDHSPRADVHVLATADESTYKQNKPMGDHPIIWTNEKFRRMIYIGIGHDSSLCNNVSYTTMIRDAILWAAEPGDKKN